MVSGARGRGPWVLMGLALGCSSAPVAPSEIQASSTILFDTGLFVTSPDEDAVVRLDPETLVEEARVSLEGEPRELARAGDALVVTRARSSTVVVLNDGLSVLRTIATPCRSTRAVVADAQRALVSCPLDGRLLVLDLELGRVAGWVSVGPSPGALARIGDGVAVSARGHILTLSWARLREAAGEVALGEVRVSERSYHEGPGVSASQLDALGAAADGFLAVYQRVENADQGLPPQPGGYGAVGDAEPRLAPRLAAGGCGPAYARFDGGARVASGPSAVAYAPATRTVWITHRYTDNVLVLDCGPGGGAVAPVPGDGSPALVASFRVGRAPRGITLAPDGRTAFVDVGLDQAVARLELPLEPDPGVPREAAATARRPMSEVRGFSRRAAVGRRLFSDAVNTHLTPSGVVTCESCHPGGDEDGLTWFIHTALVPPKLRRTLPAWAAKQRLAPFHWDGEFADAVTLTQTTVAQLMEGDGLAVDLGAIATYLEELRPPPPRPSLSPGARAGRAVFERARMDCLSCHPGPDFADGVIHQVPRPKTPRGWIGLTTPTLLGVATRAPYLHDGSAPTLSVVFTRAPLGDPHARAVELGPDEFDALIEFLESL